MMHSPAPKVAIIDYQLSNLFSVEHACAYVGLEANITSDPQEVLAADAAILPGVGAFGDAMRNLQEFGLVDAIHALIKQGKPFMGVCLGLQLLFSESNEFGQHKGLDIIPGTVTKFPDAGKDGVKRKVPQIAWNQIFQPEGQPNRWQDSPLKRIANGEFMYFVHSYYVVPKQTEDQLTVTDYDGVTYCSAVLRNNVFATQFHPEKSGREGIKIYEDWAATIKKSV